MRQYARVRNGIVVNIEVGDPSWPQIGGGGDLLIEYDPDVTNVHIFGLWNETEGFSEPDLVGVRPIDSD